MPKLIVRGYFAMALIFNSGALNELEFCHEPFTNVFCLAGIDFRRGAHGLRRKSFAGNAGASEDTLLDRTELLELCIDQLIECLRYVLRDSLNRRGKRPFPLKPRNQTLLRDVLKNRDHE